MKAVRILAIETSSPRLSLAVGTDQKVLKSYQGPLKWRHAETLFDAVKKLLAQVRWPVQSLSGVVVSIGPGSFTGIRIGLAVARALGQALNVPVAGVSSLQVIAEDALKPGRMVCPMINALRGEVFTALYRMDERGRVRTLWKECRLPFPEAARKLKALNTRQISIAGDAVPLHKEGLGGIKSGETFPKAGILLEIGRPLLGRRQKNSYERVMPLYLRAASAQERRGR